MLPWGWSNLLHWVLGCYIKSGRGWERLKFLGIRPGDRQLPRSEVIVWCAMRNLDQRQNGSSFIGNPKEMMDIQRKSCYLLWKLVDFENHGQRWSQQQEEEEEEQQQQQPLTCAFENDATCTSEDCCDRHWNCPQCTGCFSRCEVVHDVELCTIQISISISFNTRDIKTFVLFFSGYYFQQISTQQTLKHPSCLGVSWAAEV